MVLSPQAFHNLNVHADIFNHSNIHFWEYSQPGYDALGFISCTGIIPDLDKSLSVPLICSGDLLNLTALLGLILSLIYKISGSEFEDQRRQPRTLI